MFSAVIQFPVSYHRKGLESACDEILHVKSMEVFWRGLRIYRVSFMRFYGLKARKVVFVVDLTVIFNVTLSISIFKSIQRITSRKKRHN